LQKSLSLNASQEKANFMVGYIFAQEKNYAKAILAYSAAIKINANYAEAYYWRAFSYFELQKNQLACADWKKAKKLNFKDAINQLNKNCTSD